MPEIRFDDKIVVITGAGAGLGRAYALELGRRGARVIVNDINKPSADAVVAQINSFASKKTSIANYNSVTEGDKIIATAISSFGRIDVLVNNAGILRDISMIKMTELQWDSLYDVHLKGTFICTHAAWKYMVAQKYGRIITIASIAGICGNFGQVNYATMKSAMIGFTKSLAKEGTRHNIKVNCLVPLAASQMTEKLLPIGIKDSMLPENVSPVVSFLTHETCVDTGEIIEVAAGWVTKMRFQRAKGEYFKPPYSAEQVRSKWEGVGDYSVPDYPKEIHDTITLSALKSRMYYLFLIESTCKLFS